ncbi:DUF748 domain-containing protein [Alloalcanivorax marinus]|uniref:DUF748 domain-containing protein n=1 Tax=Alloalcanivorax marinus TaxID=1177169 RepID=UPI0019339265|nr:DUF748 domain-containing protein [Alloalcanivorax marinus]MBL7249547.1 DUF748 domain-containing protein [Alloalcanivorax marinus]
MQTPARWWRSRGWGARVLAILAALYVLYALVVFFLLPGWVRDQARERLTGLLGRDVTLERVALNPFTLSLTAEGFSVADPDTGTLARFDRLYVNGELWASLFHWRPWVGDLDLDGLRVRLRREADGTLNLDDIIARLSQDDPQADDEQTPEQDQETGPPAFTVSHLSLSNGGVDLIDAAGEEPVTLALPMAFTIDDLTTRGVGEDDNRYQLRVEGPDGGTLDWDGRFHFAPFSVDGRLRMDKVDLVAFGQLLAPHFRFAVPAGVLGLGADYRFSAELGQGLTVDNGELTLDGLRIRPRDGDEDSLVVPELAVTGVALDTAGRTLTVPEVTVREPAARAVLTDQGLDLATLFLPEDPKQAERAKEEVRERAEDTAEELRQGEADWRIRLDRFAVEGAAAVFRDTTLATPRELTLTDGALTVSDFRLDQEGVRWQWQGDTKVLESGTLSHSGEGRLAPLDLKARLKVEGLPLATLSPWVRAAMPITVDKGRAGGDLNLAVSGDTPTVRLTGRASVADGALSENGRRFLSVANLSADGLDLNTGTEQVAIDGLAARGLNFLHVLDGQGRSLGERLAGDDGGAEEGAAWRVRLGRVSVKDSRLAHQDLTLSPEYQVTVEQWQGHMDGFDSAGGRAGLETRGEVNGTATLTLKGTVDANPVTLDLDGSLKGYGMQTLTPFTARYLGFGVDRGRLDVQSRVSLKGERLDSTTEVAADDFYLGERVASDQAMDVPVKLGLSVLRDGSGMIRLPVSLSGDLSDPDFSVGGLVFRVLRNVLVKAATAPFSMLAGLVGGGDGDLEYVPYAAGEDRPGAQTRQALETLARILEQRGNLILVLTGETNDEDRRALGEAELVDEMGGDWRGLDTALTGQEGRERILEAYRDRLDADPAGLGDDDTERARQAWRRLLEQAAEAVDGDALADLAATRAERARRLLTGELGVDAERVRMARSRPDGDRAGVALGAEGL